MSIFYFNYPINNIKKMPNSASMELEQKNLVIPWIINQPTDIMVVCKAFNNKDKKTKKIILDDTEYIRQFDHFQIPNNYQRVGHTLSISLLVTGIMDIVVPNKKLKDFTNSFVAKFDDFENKLLLDKTNRYLCDVLVEFKKKFKDLSEQINSNGFSEILLLLQNFISDTFEQYIDEVCIKTHKNQQKNEKANKKNKIINNFKQTKKYQKDADLNLIIDDYIEGSNKLFWDYKEANSFFNKMQSALKLLKNNSFTFMLLYKNFNSYSFDSDNFLFESCKVFDLRDFSAVKIFFLLENFKKIVSIFGFENEHTLNEIINKSYIPFHKDMKKIITQKVVERATKNSKQILSDRLDAISNYQLDSTGIGCTNLSRYNIFSEACVQKIFKKDYNKELFKTKKYYVLKKLNFTKRKNKSIRSSLRDEKYFALFECGDLVTPSAKVKVIPKCGTVCTDVVLYKYNQAEPILLQGWNNPLKAIQNTYNIALMGSVPIHYNWEIDNPSQKLIITRVGLSITMIINLIRRDFPAAGMDMANILLSIIDPKAVFDSLGMLKSLFDKICMFISTRFTAKDIHASISKQIKMVSSKMSHFCNKTGKFFINQIYTAEGKIYSWYCPLKMKIVYYKGKTFDKVKTLLKTMLASKSSPDPLQDMYYYDEEDNSFQLHNSNVKIFLPDEVRGAFTHGHYYPDCFFEYCMTLISGDIVDIEINADDNTELQGASTIYKPQFLVTLVDFLSEVICNIFGGVHGGITEAIKKLQLFSSVLNLLSRTKSCIWDSMYAVFLHIFEQIFYFMTGRYYNETASGSLQSDMHNWISVVQPFIRDDVVKRMVVETGRVTKLKSLVVEGDRIVELLSKNFVAAHAVTAFMKTYDEIRMLFVQHQNFLISDGSRHTPISLWFSGAPGKGKSSLIPYLVNCLYQRMYGVKMNPNEIYQRRTVNEYWDGYANQFCVLYDDILRTTTEKTREVETSEYCDIISNVPFQLHMANLADKKGVYFNSPLVVAISNIEEMRLQHENLCLLNNNAMTRRRDFIIEVTENSSNSTSRTTFDPTGYKLRVVHNYMDPTRDVSDFTNVDVEENVPLNELIFIVNEFAKNRFLVEKSFYETALENFDHVSKHWDHPVLQGIPSCDGFVPNIELDGFITDDLTADDFGFTIKNDTLDAYQRYSTANSFKEALGETFYSNVYANRFVGLKDVRVWNRVARRVFEPEERKFMSPLYNGATSDNHKFINLDDGMICEVVTTREQEMWRGIFDFVVKTIGTVVLIKSSVSMVSTIFKKSHDLVWGNKKIDAELDIMVQDEEEVEIAPRIVTVDIKPEGSVVNKAKSRPISRHKYTKMNFVSTNSLPTINNAQGSRDITTETLLDQCFHKSLLHLVLYYKGKKTDSQYALAIGNRWIVTTNHFFLGIPEGEYQLFMISGDRLIELFIVKHLISGNQDIRFSMCDSKSFKQYPNISKHFLSDEDIETVDVSSIILCNRNGETNTITKMLCGNGLFYGDMSVNGKNYLNHDIRVDSQNVVQYSSSTKPGDCGSLLLLQNSHSHRKILGLHAAGKVMSNLGYGQIITKESIEYVLGDFTKSDDIYDLGEQKGVPNASMVPVLQGLSVVQIFEDKYKNNIVSKSKIRKTPFYEWDDNKAITAPAVLRSTDRGDPLFNSLEKLKNKDTKIVSNVILNQALDDLLDIYQPLIDKDPSSMRLLSYSEVINGDIDLEVRSMERGTSPGFPWTKPDFFEKNKKGKNKYLELVENEYILTDKILSIVNKREQNLEKGIRSCTIWTDQLKDERRSLEKVRECKTRLFSSCPLDYYIVLKKYVGALGALMMKYSSCTPIAIGINPHSVDWKNLYSYLTSINSDNSCIAGDFKNFDGDIPPQLGWLACAFINRLYDDGNDVKRMILFEDIINPQRLISNVVYEVYGGNPSGNPITSLYNSICHYFMLSIVYNHYTYTHHRDVFGKFNNYVRVTVYGDDDVIVVSKEIQHFYTFPLLTSSLFGLLGMTYTNSIKSNDDKSLFHSLNQIRYLKRLFKPDPNNGVVWAPLPLNEIIESTYWYHKGPDRDRRLISILESALFELVHFDKPTFDYYKEKFKELVLLYNLPMLEVSYFDRRTQIIGY